jgi:hypothetical protein
VPAVDEPAVAAIFAGAVVVLVHLAFRALRARRRLVGTPTSAAASVHIGSNRVCGRVRPAGEPLLAPITGLACSGWSYRVDDECRRESIWPQRRRYWKAVASHHKEVQFDLVDETGAVKVRPEGASIVGFRTVRLVTHRLDPAFAHLAPAVDLPDSTGRRRITELVLPLDRPTIVTATGRLRPDVAEPELAWDPADRTLLVSSVDLAVHAGRHAASAAGSLLAAAVALACLPLAIRSGDIGYGTAVAESGAWAPMALAGTVVVVVAHWLQYVHNDLVDLRERVQRARSLLDVELRRRHDLLPPLATAAAAAAGHEHELLVTVAERAPGPRAEAPGGAAVGSMADADSLALQRIAAVVEAHPELAASENFRAVKSALVVIENRIALARRFCADSTSLYEQRRATVPTSLVAGALGFGPIERAATR